MKNLKPLRFYFITCICLFALCTKVLGAEADNEDPIQFPSQQETLSFLKKRIPITVKILEQVKNNEGDEQYGEVIDDFRNKFSDYLEIKEHDGLEAAELYLSGLSIDLSMDVLLHHYHEDTKTSEERKKLNTQIRSLLQERLEHDKQAVKMQLKLIDKERKKLTKELQEMKKFGAAEIELEFRALLKVRGGE
ncbi:hypothetical protein OAL86_07550 [Verrucomicrobia bacterium]|jgi:hypothetical protein|nr:hypothetical protein [Verrucomicrobiota bacterium]